MAEDLTYRNEAAAGYDRAFAHVSAHFVPFLLRAARVAQNMRVLDIATGTGLAAAAALAAVGPTGHVTAADLSSAMVEKARGRLGNAPNVSVAVEDGQALSFPDGSFDAVICSLGLMFFPDPARGLAEFRRVLRPGGRAAVSVNTVPERSFNTRINVAIARRVPALAEAAARVFSLGDAARLRSLFEAADFQDVEVATEAHRFLMPSFDAYFEPYEQGAGSPGQAFVALSAEIRRAVREEVRRDLGDAGGPIAVEVEIRFCSGRRY
jgi:ubiquinone/menaquinone biosynthesis C-methylase UbiE